MQRESQQQHLLGPLSTKWVENAAGVSRDTVAAWRRGRTPRTDQWERFIAAFNAWREGQSDAQKESPPEWARTLPVDVANELIARLGDLAPVVDQAAAELGLHGRQPDAPSHEGDGVPQGGGRTTPQPRA